MFLLHHWLTAGVVVRKDDDSNGPAITSAH